MYGLGVSLTTNFGTYASPIPLLTSGSGSSQSNREGSHGPERKLLSLINPHTMKDAIAPTAISTT